MLCYKCNEDIPENSLVCPRCGAEMSVFARRTYHSGTEANPFAGFVPMNWYKFLIYFSLFASALTNFINGIGYLTGYVYNIQSAGEINAYMIYMQYGRELMIIDICYGAFCIAFAIFNLVTRYRLAKYKKNGPLCLYIMYIAGALVSAAYPVLIQFIGGVPGTFGSIIFMQLAIELAFLYANYIYFSKRKHFFVN